jgi:hypothetical protein
MRKPAIALVFVPFFVYSLWVAATHGPLGWLTLAGRDPWALQMLLDLAIALFVVGGLVVRDAKARGRNPWPWVVGTVLVGSIAPMIYAFTRPRDGSR